MREVDPRVVFHAEPQLRLNLRRLEHLAELGLAPRAAKVMEVGAGIGDCTSFFTDRGCGVMVSDGRPENVAMILAGQSCVAQRRASVLDLDRPGAPPAPADAFDVAVCMGVLHLVADPARTLAYLASCLRPDGRLLLELEVSPEPGEALNPRRVPSVAPDESVHGSGCRPTRAWVMARLRETFAHAYTPTLRPHHALYPRDWAQAARAPRRPWRAFFVASRASIDNPALSASLVDAPA